MKRLVVALPLAWPLLVSGQVIEYYHLDALGSVRAVTSQAGTIVERHDYLPFGEECTTPGSACASNPQGTVTPFGTGQPKEFTGKERDKETGYDYFGARYYGAKVGRFTSVDRQPRLRARQLNPQAWNKYSQSLNNPLNYADPDGNWPSKTWMPTHQDSVDRALPQVSAADRQVIKDSVVEADESQFQTADMAYRHGMRGAGMAGGDQSVEQARTKFNDFIRTEIAQAQYFERVGAHISALVHLGYAMHALQDYTSPAHRGFKEWRTEWNKAYGLAHLSSIMHGVHELEPDSVERAELDRATTYAWEYFTGAREMPDDFTAGFESSHEHDYSDTTVGRVISSSVYE